MTVVEMVYLGIRCEVRDENGYFVPYYFVGGYDYMLPATCVIKKAVCDLMNKIDVIPDNQRY